MLLSPTMKELGTHYYLPQYNKFAVWISKKLKLNKAFRPKAEYAFVLASIIEVLAVQKIIHNFNYLPFLSFPSIFRIFANSAGQWFQNFFPDHVTVAEGFSGPLNDLNACLRTVMRCAIDARDENKEVSTVLDLFHKRLGTSVLVCVLLLILFHSFGPPITVWEPLMHGIY
jgi:hypothetical protein